MDDDTAALIRQICTRAGMIMEDMSARAIGIGEVSHAELLMIATDIETAGRDIAALGKAAVAIARR